jgi:HEAT repeat protein
MTKGDRTASIDAARRRGEAALAGHAKDETAARSFLADPDPNVRATALGALVRMGRATPTDAASGLADPDGSARRYACELGAALAGADFASLLEDGDDMVLEAACYALGEVRDRAAVPALVRIATGHKDPLCRESAVAALGAVGDPEGLPAILTGLEDKPQIRRRAVVALAAFDTAQAQAALKRCLQDPDWQVRQAAEDLLGVTGGDD